MDVINGFLVIIDWILTLFISISFYIILGLIILGYYLIRFFIYDKKYFQHVKMDMDPESITLDDLKTMPLINIIIPAWKEGSIFKNLLDSIKGLTYPRLRIIINAGGNEETIEIAQFYKRYDNFIILRQEGGSERPSMGKVKALNDCLKYITEGLVYFIDADSYLTDEILLRMIYPITNLEENIVFGGVRPLKTQESKGLVQYLLVDRLRLTGSQFRRRISGSSVTGQNFCLKYDVIKKVGAFSEKANIPTDISMGQDIFAYDYEAYQLVDYRHRIYVDYSSNFQEYLKQKTIWTENNLVLSYRTRKIKLLKFILLFVSSLYLFIFPFLVLFAIRFFMIGLTLLIILYSQKLYKYFIFTKLVNKENYSPFSRFYLLKLIYYIYLEALIIIQIPIHFIIFIKKLKKSKA